MFDRILNATLPFTPKIGNIPWNVWRRSPEFLMTFPGIFGDISQNVWRHSPEYLVAFRGMFDDILRNLDDIPRNIWRHSPECLRIFPRMFSNIPRNVWRNPREYNIPPIPPVPRIPFPVPVFLVSCIAENFPFLILRIPEFFARELCKFLKK